MIARIVIFLGELSHVKRAKYARWDHMEQFANPGTHFPWRVLVDDAATTSHCDLVQVVAICSAATSSDWEYHLAEDLNTAGFSDRNHTPIGLLTYDEASLSPAGGAFWGLFEMLHLSMSGAALLDSPNLNLVVGKGSDRDAFKGPADFVGVDITHGYRAVPFIGAAALSFAQASNRRQERNVTHHIFYAAMDAMSTSGVIPVWDLTPFVDSVELGDALDAFARYGRADDLARFLGNSEVEAAGEIAEPMKQFADDLLLMRIPSLLKDSAPKMQRVLSRSIDALRDAFPPLGDDLDRFMNRANLFAPEGNEVIPVSAGGIRSAIELAQYLWDTGRYADLYNLMREALLTAFSVVAVVDTLTQPQTDCFDDQRGVIDRNWKNWLHQTAPKKTKNNKVSSIKTPLPNEALAVLQLLEEVADRRNDVAHCSMRSKYRTAAELRADLKDNLDKFHRVASVLRGGE